MAGSEEQLGHKATGLLSKCMCPRSILTKAIARAGQNICIPVPVLRWVNIVLAVAMIGGRVVPLSVGFLQDYPIDLGNEWNGIAGTTGVVTGLVLRNADVFKRRGLLMTAAVLSLFLINLYATWLNAPTYWSDFLSSTCGTAASPWATTLCTDEGLHFAEMVLN